MTPFQKYAWKRYGFLIVDNHRPQLINGKWHPAATVVERDGGVRPSTGYETLLWNRVRKLWQAEQRARKGGEH